MHPSIFVCLSMIGSQRQQIQKGSPVIPLPSDTSLLLLGDPVKISSARSESALGFPSSRSSLVNRPRDSRHTNQRQEIPKLTPFNAEEQHFHRMSELSLSVWAQPLYIRSCFQLLVSVVLFCLSWSLPHDHKRWLERRWTSISKAIPFDTTPSSPQSNKLSLQLKPRSISPSLTPSCHLLWTTLLQPWTPLFLCQRHNTKLKRSVLPFF